MLYILIYKYILCSYIKGTRVSGEATVSGSEPHEERVDTRHSRSTGRLSATSLAFIKKCLSATNGHTE